MIRQARALGSNAAYTSITTQPVASRGGTLDGTHTHPLFHRDSDLTPAFVPKCPDSLGAKPRPLVQLTGP